MSKYKTVRAKTLDDLTTGLVIVPIRMPDGRTVEVPLRQVSGQRMWEMRREVTWPKPPAKDATRDRVIYDHADPAYVAALEDANRLFTHKILIASLAIELPGETEAEQIAAFQAKVGQGTFLMLVEASQRINTVRPEEVAAVALSFRSE